MKTVYIPVKIKSKVNKKKIKSLSRELPKNIAIAYSIQYKDIAFEIKKLLPNNVTKTIETQETSLTEELGKLRDEVMKTMKK